MWMRWIVVLVLGSTGVRAHDLRSLDALFAESVIEARTELSGPSRGDGHPPHRVLLRLPNLSPTDWRLYRQSLRPRVEGLLRAEGYSDLLLRELEVDADSSSLHILGVRPTAELARPALRAKRVHLIANRAATGECYISYEVRIQ